MQESLEDEILGAEAVRSTSKLHLVETKRKLVSDHSDDDASQDTTRYIARCHDVAWMVQALCT